MSSRIPVVVIDPGHGGSATVGGSSSNNAHGPNGLLEKNLTLDLARRVRSLLAGRVRVMMTRDSDTNLSLAARARVGRDNHADVFLSIHLNGFHNPQVDGTEVWVARDAGPQSRALAQSVLDQLLTGTQTPNRHVRERDLGVLLRSRHAPHTAACLAEVAFLTNPEQAHRLESEPYRQRLAQAMTEAVGRTLHLAPTTTQSLAAAIGGYGGSSLHRAGVQSLAVFEAQQLRSQISFVLGHSVGKRGVNNGDDVQTLKDHLIGLGFDWLSSNRSMDPDTINVIKLFQSIVQGLNTVAGDGRVDVPGTAYRWLQAANAPRWQIMPAGSTAEGFYNAELADTADHHDFGTNWLADTLKGAAATYRDTFRAVHATAALLTLNDVSLPRGGDTPDHAGHECGLACDLRLPRTDGTAPGATTFRHALYDQAATRGMLQALRAQALFSRIFFNDPVLIGERLCENLHGHDDHIHFEIKPPAQGGIALIDVRDTDSAAAAYQQPDELSSFPSAGHSPASVSSRALQVTTTCPPGVTRPAGAPACSTTALPAGEALDNCSLLVGARPAHGTVTPNLFLRWNDIPAGACQIDVVVHFHGYANPEALRLLSPPVLPSQMTVEHKKNLSGIDFVNPSGPTSIARRSRPTLCVLPLGHFSGANPRTSREYDFPFFTSNQNGLRDIINYSLNFLASRLRLSANPFTPCRLILTAHSGGGGALASVLDMRVPGTRNRCYNVHEVHLFDAVYGQEGQISSWAEERIAADSRRTVADMPVSGSALRVFYLPCSPDNWEFKTARNRCELSQTETRSRLIHLRLVRAIRAIPSGSFLSSWYRVEQAPGTIIRSVSASLSPARISAHGAIPAAYGFQLLSNASINVTPTPSAPPASAPACCPQWPNECQRPTTCRNMPAPAVTPAQALDKQTRQGPLPYREAGEMVNTNCNLEADTWSSRIQEAETRLTRGLMSRFPPTAVADFEALRRCYELVGRTAEFEPLRRRLQAVLPQIMTWVFDVNQSAVAQIENATERARLLPGAWGPVFYPNTARNHDALSRELFAQMARLVPERRVPQLIHQLDIDNLVVTVPGESCRGCRTDQPHRVCKLLPVAADSYVSMRTAAAAFRPSATTPGVLLQIGSAWRSAEEQQNLGAAQPNRAAVAGNRSAHRYGLAIDLCMNLPGVSEIRTNPITNLVQMYKSPVYKWMYLFGAHFGWYPFSFEPWHWEFNPPGFPERFPGIVRDLRARRAAGGSH